MSKEISIIKNRLEQSPLLEVLGNKKEKYILSVLGEISKTANDFKKDLTKCTPDSIVTAIKQACDLELEIDARQHCHLIRYNKNIGKKENPIYISEAQLQIGYRGYIYAIKRAYPDANIDCVIVHEGDEFTLKKEGDTTTYTLEVKDPFGQNRKIVGGFCYISYSIEGKQVSFCETMPVSEINKIKSCAKSSDIWDKWFEEKAKVAIIRRACKIHFSGMQQIADMAEHDNKDFNLAKESTFLNVTADICDEDIKEMRQEQNQKDFARIKESIESCGSVEEIEGILEKEKKIVNSLKKYAVNLFEMLEASWEGMKEELDPEGQEA